MKTIIASLLAFYILGISVYSVSAISGGGSQVSRDSLSGVGLSALESSTAGRRLSIA